MFNGAELSSARSKGFGQPSCGMAGASLRADFVLLCLGEGDLNTSCGFLYSQNSDGISWGPLD